MLDDCGDSLSAVQWNKIKSAFAAHQSWVQAKPTAPLEQLPLEKLRGYLDDSYARTVRGLIADSVPISRQRSDCVRAGEC